jgi:hypothetical protein
MGVLEQMQKGEARSLALCAFLRRSAQISQCDVSTGWAFSE